MKIVTWNCNGALRKKTKEADSLNADILVVQECENPEESTVAYREWAGDYLWIGKSKNKGIGVFSRSGQSLEACNWSGQFSIKGFEFSHKAMEWKTEDLELFLPCLINGEIQLLAVWTKAASSPNFGYMGQFWKYLQIHREELSRSRTVILGDFNSNAIWDQSDRWWSHSDVVRELSEIGVMSLYHSRMGESQGEETAPTFFLHRNVNKPYHIDYVFLSSDLLSESCLSVGKTDDWLGVSDHMPLSAEIK